MFAAARKMNLHSRHFLKLLDVAPLELQHLVQSTLTLKRLHTCRQNRPALLGKNLALLFEHLNRESRWSAEAALAKQGAGWSYFGPGETGLGVQDQVSCSSRQLGRLFDGLVLHGLDQEVVEEVGRLAGVPVCNLGSLEFQPLPVLADLATMTEYSARPLSEMSLVLLGDGTTSLAQSMLVGASKLGLDLRCCGPKGLQPDDTLVETCLALAAETGAQIRLFTEPEQAVKGADFVYAQSWAFTGTKGWEKRVKSLLPYRATSDLLSQSGQASCKLLHRLPVVVDDETEVGRQVVERFKVDGLEVSKELFDSASNLAFEQAENFLHCCQAVLIALLA